MKEDDLIHAASSSDLSPNGQLHSVPAKTLRDHAREIYDEGMQCCCDLDNWEPTRHTGHSHVCSIHRTAYARFDAAERAAASVQTGKTMGAAARNAWLIAGPSKGWEAAADAVIEECAKRIDTLREKAAAVCRDDHVAAYHRAAYALRSLKASPQREGDRPAIPAGVYWSVEAGNFYDEATNRGMGLDFYEAWQERNEEFPVKETDAPGLDLYLDGQIALPASAQREGDRPVFPPYGRLREPINRPVEEEGE